MSEAGATKGGQSPVELTVGPRRRDLAGLTVNRVWPTARRRLIGPFIFFDHLERVDLAPRRGLDVPPHPHIGLATVTYLFEGELMHRDSLGYAQPIRPGELNWMTAGAGIVHSERSPDAERARSSSLHGIQIWVALPTQREEAEPTFVHYGAQALPELDVDGARMRLLAGEAFGAAAGVETASPLFYLEAALGPGPVCLESAMGQRAAYVVDGRVETGGRSYESGRLLVFADGVDVSVRGLPAAKLMLFGGPRLAGDRHISWNFVSSSADRIEAARHAWRERRFPAVPGDDGYMPLPAWP